MRRSSLVPHESASKVLGYEMQCQHVFPALNSFTKILWLGHYVLPPFTHIRVALYPTLLISVSTRHNNAAIPRSMFRSKYLPVDQCRFTKVSPSALHEGDCVHEDQRHDRSPLGTPLPAQRTLDVIFACLARLVTQFENVVGNADGFKLGVVTDALEERH